MKKRDISSVFSDENEIIQGVMSFECNDSYFYYENFSVTAGNRTGSATDV